MSRDLGRYGASGGHLAALLGCFALTGYAVTRLLDDTSTLVRIAVWFVGAAIAWDLVLAPALALLDRLAGRVLRRLRPGGVAVLNHVRFPALLSLLLLVLFAPLVLQRSEQRYLAKTGLTQDPYLQRWAAVTVAVFVLSALVLAVTVVRARRAR